jgi:hypothetical protein
MPGSEPGYDSARIERTAKRKECGVPRQGACGAVEEGVIAF